MQDNKIHILCTRPLEDYLLNEARDANVEIEILSFIETEFLKDITVQQEIENALLYSATVVFTSMNAVEAVALQMEEQQPEWNIYCIGNTTHDLVVKYFGVQPVAGRASNAAELAELITENDSINKVLFFCGDHRRDELPDILREHSIEVNEIIVYETIATPHKLKKNYHSILFFSPSAVESFFSINKLPANTLLFAIGNTTADAIKKKSGNKIIISDEPGKENLVNKAIEYFT